MIRDGERLSRWIYVLFPLAPSIRRAKREREREREINVHRVLFLLGGGALLHLGYYVPHAFNLLARFFVAFPFGEGLLEVANFLGQFLILVRQLLVLLAVMYEQRIRTQ